ncbi:MAG: DUF2652 domain-containing protein [Ignavibacteria bacterium]|nr:DUF2652 domain-containing protein [Ignavibacteria bacterium]
MNGSAFIFIPDISGFTEFVTHTEIGHSNHIITELIEAILHANELNFTVSEIEGDAVLFYKVGDPPPLERLLLQTKRMFFAFHRHLKIIERDTVCQCGACTTASRLTIKMIAHYGALRETAIGNFSKIIGSDVILAHRLLKNTLHESEYIVLTEQYLRTQERKSVIDPWIAFQKHTEQIENFGDVHLEYVILSPLRSLIPDLPTGVEESFPDTFNGHTIMINAPMSFVHEALTDIQARPLWVHGVKEIRSASPINRVNESHLCVFENLEVNIVTRANRVRGRKIYYSEKSEANTGFSFINDFRLVDASGSTELSVRATMVQSRVAERSILVRTFHQLKTRILLMVVRHNTKRNLRGFKRYAERLHTERITGT